MSKKIKWIVLLTVLIAVSAFFTYRWTLQSMNVEIEKDDTKATAAESKGADQWAEFKKVIDFAPVTPPSHELLTKVQYDLFVATEEIRSVRSSIYVLHQDIDFKLRPEAIVAMAKSPTASEWGQFTGDSKGKGLDTKALVGRLSNMISKISVPSVKKDLVRIQELLEKGTADSDVALLWEAHQIIHDLDYFVINYPVTVKTGKGAVEGSLNGPKQYWGVTETLGGK